MISKFFCNHGGASNATARTAAAVACRHHRQQRAHRDAYITETRGGHVPAPPAAAALARLPPPAALDGSDTAPLSLALQ